MQHFSTIMSVSKQRFIITQ